MKSKTVRSFVANGNPPSSLSPIEIKVNPEQSLISPFTRKTDILVVTTNSSFVSIEDLAILFACVTKNLSVGGTFLASRAFLAARIFPTLRLLAAAFPVVTTVFATVEPAEAALIASMIIWSCLRPIAGSPLQLPILYARRS